MKSNDGKATGMASLKYLENFDNPYVKIIIVCKICNKEQSLKFAGNWRQHYMTHSAKKPFSCPHCPKTFIRGDQMRKHVQSKHSDVANPQSMNTTLNVKQESQSFAKSEGYF